MKVLKIMIVMLILIMSVGAVCAAENITEDIIRHIATKKPLRVVFRDAGFADSPAKINVGELFKLLSPDTKVKVI